MRRWGAQQALGAQFGERRAEHHAAGDLGQRHAGRLGDERHGSAGPRVGLDDEDGRCRATAYCTLISPRTSRALAIEVVYDSMTSTTQRRQGLRRDGARRIATVHAGFLDVLHHAADQNFAGVVADRVDIDLGRIFEEPVDQYRPLGRQAAFASEGAEAGELGHRPSKVLGVVDDLHGPASEHVAGPHEHWEADALDDSERLLELDGRSARRLRDAQRCCTAHSTSRGPRRDRSTPATCRRSAPGAARRTASAGSAHRATR